MLNLIESDGFGVKLDIYDAETHNLVFMLCLFPFSFHVFHYVFFIQANFILLQQVPERRLLKNSLMKDE